MTSKFTFYQGILIFLSLLLLACSKVKAPFIEEQNLIEGTPENIIVVIGDGMGPQQIGLLQSYAKQAPEPNIKNRQTAFENMLDAGAELAMSMTYPAQSLVVDSAASASQLATSAFSGSEMIGLNQFGEPQASLLEIAKQKGKAIGLVSDTRLTHATPAAFAAHQSHRSKEAEIAEEMLALEPEIMLSGGLRYWLPESVNDQKSETYSSTKQLMNNSFEPGSKRKDEKNLLEEARQKGYSLAFSRKQLAASSGKTLGLFSNSGMANGIVHKQQKHNPERLEPSLLEMTEKALNTLSKNPDGFVLVLEAGQIDWAAHDNDTGTTLHEMLKLNETLNYLLTWQARNKNTLLLVTADHETGGFGFSYSANDLPKAIQLEGSAFKNEKYKPNFNFGKPEVFEKLYAQKKSYADIFYKEFDSLSEADQTPENLMKIVNQNTEFPITEKQAERILKMEENPFYVEGHKYLGKERVPEYHDNEAFFVYQNRLNLLAMAVSKEQHAVWSTGSHTSTPVMVFSLGPAQDRFSGFIHHTDLGEMLLNLL